MEWLGQVLNSCSELFVCLQPLTLITWTTYYLEIARVIGPASDCWKNVVNGKAASDSTVTTVDAGIVLAPHQLLLQSLRP